MLGKPKLVLCVDRDNDLYEKAGISGPIIGRDANLDAAIRLGLADAGETDTNAILKAISLHDQLSKTHSVQIATLTGSAKLGYAADDAISQQLDRLLEQFPTESCVFVSDGASDETLLPIIQSRLKIDAVEVVTMKQAKELEKTYFVILEKLRDPYYARLIFGIPAILGILFVVTAILHWAWYVPIAVISCYLLLKAFGLEEAISRAVSSFNFSVEKISLVVYLSALPLMAIAFWSGYVVLTSFPDPAASPAKIAAAALRSVLGLLLWPILLLLAGRVMDLIAEKRKVEIFKYSLYAVSSVLFWLVFWTGSAWIVNDQPPYVSFGDFVVVIIVAVIMGYLSITSLRTIKRNVLLGLKLESKEVLGAAGNYVGKVMGVDVKEGALAVKSPLGQKMMISMQDVERVGEKIVLSV
jgi:putative membrane protein